MTDTPIEEQGYLSGVKVVDIGDYRVSRGLSRRPFSGCQHHSLVYDQKERRIWCKDCKHDVEAFDAFEGLVKNFHTQTDILRRREEKLEEAENHKVRTVAAKEIDKAWGKQKMVPACPHCGYGLFPEHFKTGMAMLGKEYAMARINKLVKERD